MLKIQKLIAAILCLLWVGQASAQDPLRYTEEVKRIQEKSPAENHQGAVVFTGSSSVRMWKDLTEDFPNRQIVNTGFGGSHATDLIHFIDELVLDYAPSQVFIYEGDNDIAGKKTTAEILQVMDQIVTRIHNRFPNTEVVLISAKPSISRWNLASEYESLNKALKDYAKSKKNVGFADVWKPMLGKDGKPLADIFIQDNLHMNRKGYDIWKKVIAKHIKKG